MPQQQGYVPGYIAPRSDVQYHRVRAEDDLGDALVATSSDSASILQSTLEDNEMRISECSPCEEPSKPKLTQKGTRNVKLAYQCAVADHWLFELLGLFICVGTFVSIIAVLFAFRDSPTPRIMAGITLNTTISVLATLSRAAAVLVAASAIAQQKWLRFKQKSRPLVEMLTYDDATRGSLGSLYLLGTLRLDIITALAAIVTVLALGFEPFVQQAVRYHLQDQAISLKTPPLLPTTQNVSFENYPNLDVTSATDAAIMHALYVDSTESLQPICAGYTCNWKSYKSAAFCSLCEDATGNVSIEPKYDAGLAAYVANNYTNFFQAADLNLGSMLENPVLMKTWHTQYTVSVGQGYPVNFTLNTTAAKGICLDQTILEYPEAITWNLLDQNGTFWQSADIDPVGPSIKWQNVTINGVVGPLKAFGYVKLTYLPDLSQLVVSSAKRCLITLCAQQYSSSFTNGSLVSNVTDREWGNFQVLTSNVSRGYQVTDTSEQIFLQWVATLKNSNFRGGYFNNSNEILLGTYNSLTNLEGSVIRKHFRAQFGDLLEIFSPGENTFQFMSDIEKRSALIAQALTNLIQQYGDGNISGQAYIQQQFVEVRWAWLAFPVTIVIVVFVILIITMIQTKKSQIPVWRSSPFPLLYNFHDNTVCPISSEAEGVEFIPQACTTSKHEEMAKEMHLRLRSSAKSWVFEKTS